VAEYVDLADYLLIAEAVLGIPAEAIARWRGSGWQSRRCTRLRWASAASSSIPI
jgi:hypothetical protein